MDKLWSAKTLSWHKQHTIETFIHLFQYEYQAKKKKKDSRARARVQLSEHLGRFFQFTRELSDVFTEAFALVSLYICGGGGNKSRFYTLIKDTSLLDFFKSIWYKYN